MKRSYFLLLLVLACLILSGGQALAEENGSHFLQECHAGIAAVDGQMLSPDDQSKAYRCLSYLDGFLDANGVAGIQVNGTKLICTPTTGISPDQAARIVVKWIEANPEHMHEGRRMVVMYSLIQAFPCAQR